MFQILLCNVAVCGGTLSCWRVKTLPLALSHTSCTESHVGSVCCRHRVVHSSDHQCGQGAALGHERWHPTTVSSVHMHTDVSFNITFILSSITKVPIVFVGNWEAGLIRKKGHATTVHIFTDDVPLRTSSWPPYFPLWDDVLKQVLLFLIRVLVDVVWQFGHWHLKL